MKRKLQALIVFLLLGIGKLPFEQRTVAGLRDHGMLYQPLDYQARDAVGQVGFAAALGGLRSLVASVTYLMGFTAFEEVDWPRVDFLCNITTELQPRFDEYWKDAAEHMAYDAASYYRYNESRPRLYREQLYRQYVRRGIDILNNGLRYLPHSNRLHSTLADLYARRLEPPDHELAGQHYLLAYQNGGLPVNARLAAYEWAQLDNAPARWRTAYAILRDGYNRNLRMPGMMNYLRMLETKLNVPEPQRVR
jgi:hypothetical protein